MKAVILIIVPFGTQDGILQLQVIHSNSKIGRYSRNFASKFRLIGVVILLAFLLTMFFSPASYAVSRQKKQQSQYYASSASSGVSIYFLLSNCLSGKTNSCNWAGYYASGSAQNSVTMVNGSWIQPKIKSCIGITKPQYAMFAVGIDGAPSGSHDDTIQAGTAVECTGSSSTPRYFAWYEVWDVFTCPSGCGLTMISIKISGGNVINTILTGTCSNGGFSGSVTLNDITNGKSFTTPPGFLSIPPNDGATCLSADWMVEDPVNVAPTSSLHIHHLAQFESAKFGLYYTKVPLTCYATIAGTSSPIGSFSTASSTNMYNSKGSAIATTTILVKTDSFTVKRT